MQSLAFLSPKRRFVVTGLMGLFIVLSFYLFPFDEKLNDNVQSIVSGMVFFLVVPILFTKMILKEPLGALGFRRSERSYGWLSVPLVTITALVLSYLFIRYFSVGESYLIPPLARDSFPIFLLYETVLVGSITFLFEVFFRGFVQLLWLREYGISAVLAQVIISVASVALLGGMTWQELPMLIATPFAGFVAFYTRSVWYSWVTSWLIVVLFDACILVVR